jgi:hypothetical protein
MEKYPIDYIVLAEYEGEVRQVLLTEEMVKHLKNFIFQLFFSSGGARDCSVKLLDPPLKGLTFKKPVKETDDEDNSG